MTEMKKRWDNREDGMSLFKKILHCLDCLHSEQTPIDEGISYTIIKLLSYTIINIILFPGFVKLKALKRQFKWIWDLKHCGLRVPKEDIEMAENLTES